jgi:hypothetical protein
MFYDTNCPLALQQVTSDERIDSSVLPANEPSRFDKTQENAYENIFPASFSFVSTPSPSIAVFVNLNEPAE